MSIPPSLEYRLAKAEAALASLTRELAEIRAGLSATPSGAPMDEAPAPPRPEEQTPPRVGPPPRPRVRREAKPLDFERLLGRYGMLGIAVLAAVAAVGTFLSWAISHGYLTLNPPARVIIGLAFATGIGAWGIKLRPNERSFGSSLVGLALVIVLVCAYAAGPGFHLVPTWVAFVGSAAIAWGLAIFARGEDDEPLWCVAFGGASIAPFATSDNTGNLYGLLAYGLVLLLSSCWAVSHRTWPVAWRVFYLASALFVGVSTSLAYSRDVRAVAVTFAFPLVIGAAGILPFAPDSRKRAALRWLAILALGVTAVFGGHWDAPNRWILASEVLLAVALWLLIIDRTRGVAQSSLFAQNASRAPMLDWIDGAAIPLFLVLRAASVGAPGLSKAAIYAVAAAMLFVSAWRHPVGPLRDAAALTVMLLISAVLYELLPAEVLRRVSGLLVLALFALAMFKARPSFSWMTAGAVVLAVAGELTLVSLIDRPAYTVPPFSTQPSLLALLVTLTLAIVARFWRWLHDGTRVAMDARPRRRYADLLCGILAVVMALPWLWAFVWALIELAMTHSPSISTLLLVIYFAAMAVASVAVGRARRSARIRQVGLFLALAAAATSVYGASTYFDIGIRIVAYLVTSAFLLGIAYWYRRPGAEPATA